VAASRSKLAELRRLAEPIPSQSVAASVAFVIYFPVRMLPVGLVSRRALKMNRQSFALALGLGLAELLARRVAARAEWSRRFPASIYRSSHDRRDGGGRHSSRDFVIRSMKCTTRS
jgi:hypothetical protein